MCAYLVSNGAYDGGAIYNPKGSFSFFSFKDLNTLKVFNCFE